MNTAAKGEVSPYARLRTGPRRCIATAGSHAARVLFVAASTGACKKTYSSRKCEPVQAHERWAALELDPLGGWPCASEENSHEIQTYTATQKLFPQLKRHLERSGWKVTRGWSSSLTGPSVEGEATRGDDGIRITVEELDDFRPLPTVIRLEHFVYDDAERTRRAWKGASAWYCLTHRDEDGEETAYCDQQGGCMGFAQVARKKGQVEDLEHCVNKAEVHCVSYRIHYMATDSYECMPTRDLCERGGRRCGTAGASG